jgi:hypothetical protein
MPLWGNLAQGDVFDLVKKLQELDFDMSTFHGCTTRTWQASSLALTPNGL